jgi:CheY-like chemotaxis protein
MSHELRTPLTAIIGFSQLSLRGSEIVNLSNRQKSNLERVLKNGQHLLNLVNDVLDIAKIEAGRMDISQAQLELEPFMNSIIEQTQSLATEKGLKFTSKVDDNIGTIETDADKLRQILINLISNAIKFTHTGEVSLTAHLDSEGPEGFKTGQEWVEITVKDTGIGIPLEKQAQIFDEFYQVDNSSTRNYGGTGLGLSIVRKLTELLEGKLKLESQPGAGSSFTILLPRKPARVQVDLRPQRPTLFSPILVGEPDRTVLIASQPTDSSNEDAALDRALQTSHDLGKKLVVSIDDDLDVVDLIQHALEGTAYYVVGLSEPTRALSTITRLHPYAVTLDVMMPQSNGWQVLQQLKSEPATAAIPVIMLSVVADRSAGFVLGANEYLVKPIDREILLRTLDRLTRNATEEVASLELVASSEPGKSSPGKTAKLATRARDILVVDDEPDIRNVLDQAISEAGYSVRTAAGGLEALRLIDQARPGVILLDLMMPDMDGFEVLQRLRSNPATSNIPVVVLTAKILTSHDYERLQRDANQIIQKGSRPLEEVLNDLQTLLARAS